MKHPFLLIHLCLLMLLTPFVGDIAAAEPLDFRQAVPLAGPVTYSPRGVGMLRFENTEYFKLAPGILRWQPWYASTLDLQLMGNDIFAKRAEEAQPYVHTLYLTFLRVGRTFSWRSLEFFADVHGGLFYTNAMDELAAAGIEVKNNRSAALGLSLGVRWVYGDFQADLSLGLAGMTGQSLAESHWELTYRISKKWKIGLFSEGITRGVELCEDTKDPACQYKLQMVYGAVYASWNCWRSWWLLFGFGVSSITLGTDDESTRESTDPAIYIGIR
ncbi:MAG: hypothetical protein CVU65_14870 [Deltaproteobacteria bacterium HGW-Deltaproteobacteria-22]|nr:MAG: hypothetical protein CVU65_14870 [Deltaproteobacteria bacterium HGW-Deltaproteobacteria-22]